MNHEQGLWRRWEEFREDVIARLLETGEYRVTIADDQEIARIYYNDQGELVTEYLDR